jgi:hypothetical protein
LSSSKDSGLVRRNCLAVTGNTAASYEIGCTSESYERAASNLLRLAAPTMTFLFPRDLRGLRCLVVPHFICTRWVHPLLRFALSLEYVSVPGPLRMRTCSTPFLRFRSPSRHQPREYICDERPTSHLPPFSVFHPLSTVSPLLAS